MCTITVWKRFHEKHEKFEHNHISNGYIEKDLEPIAISVLQKKAWPKSQWRKEKAKLINNVVYIE